MKKIIFLLICASCSLFAQKSDKPNIILIYADDMGYGDPGVYGGSKIPTPNIDRLAKEGVKFTNGYVSAPVCGPSRYGLLSGAYQQRFGVQANEDTWAKIPGVPNILPKKQKTINQTLSLAGYKTGMVGKWNLEGSPKTTFDESMSVMHFIGLYWPDEKGHYSGVNETNAKRSSDAIKWGPEREGDEYLTDRLGRQSVEFIERNKEQPFFLYMAFNAPHDPMQAKKVHQDAVAHIPTEAYRLYAAMTISMDENIGRVLDTLEKLGIRDNTLIVFASDNGPTNAFSKKAGWLDEWPKEMLGSTGPLSGWKNQFWEGGIRVPFIMSWPDRLKKGMVYDSPVSTLDLYPTFCAAANQKIPEETIIDGVDLVPYITGEKQGQPHDKLYWYDNEKGAMRDGDWKLWIHKNTVKLFNLKTDLAEKKDLAESNPKIKDRMYSDWKAFKDEMPLPVNQEWRLKQKAKALEKVQSGNGSKDQI